jgi:purine-binding chemotaxis protein CheW
VAEPGVKSEVSFLCYRVGAQDFAVSFSKVARILPLVPMAKIPHTPEFLEGVVEYQGALIPVVDLRKRLELTGTGDILERRIVVVNINGEKIGMIVDGAKEMVYLKPSSIKKPAALVRGLDASYFIGVVKLDDRYIVVLDLPRVLTSEERLTLFGLEGLLSGEEPPAKRKRRKEGRKEEKKEERKDERAEK